MPRLDQILVERGLCPTRTKAQASVLAGQVRINGRPAIKPGEKVTAADRLEMVAPERYVSRGGHKLQHALEQFGIHLDGARTLDLGASTGGFTDCLLQHGAVSVHAVDVGHGQLAWKLRQDPRVLVMERTNARHLAPASFGPDWRPFDVIVADCSFISLRKILPSAIPLLRPGGQMVALVKPQFEAGREEADRGAGVITDPLIHERVLTELREFTAGSLPAVKWCHQVESPLRGPAGNKEFLVLLQKTGHAAADSCNSSLQRDP